MWKNEDKTLPHLLKMKIAFWKMLKTEDLKSTVKDAKKMKTVSCARSPIYWMVKNANKSFIGQKSSFKS